MSLTRRYRLISVLTALATLSGVLSLVPVAAGASPMSASAIIPQPSRALRGWAGSHAGAVIKSIHRNADKVPTEFDERLRWADSDGSLQVMVTLTQRDASVEAFVAASTVQVSWYGDDPRFLARITPAQLISLLNSSVVLFVEPDYPMTNFMSDSTRDVRARTPDADGVYSFDPDAGEMGQLVSNIDGLTAAQVTGSGVRVAVTDSGIDKTHRDFGGWDCEAGPYEPCESRIAHAAATEHLVGFETSDGLPTTEAASGHGSHVAGTILGNGYYSRDFGADASRYGGDGFVIGIAPSAELVSVKNGDSQSAGFSTAALQWQLDHAAELGIKMSSNSWGCLGGCSFNGNSAIAQIFRDLYNAGVVVVFAAGNDGGSDNGSEFSGNAQSPYVLGVAAYDDSNDRLASFSSRGSSAAPLFDPETWTPEGEPVNGTRRPDVAAPGVSIWSAASLTGGTSAGLPRVSIGDVDQGRGPTVEYRTMSGTSMATPHVAGAAALLSGACPDAAPLDLMRAIMVGANGDKVLKTTGSALAEPFEVGYGGLDVRTSLDRILGLPVCGGDLPWGSGGGSDPSPPPSPPPPSPSPTPNAVGEVLFGPETAPISVGNPVTGSFGLGITEADFLLNGCTVADMETQGVDGHVFELTQPTGESPTDTVTLKGSTQMPYDLDMRFYGADCSSLGNGVATFSPDEIGLVPDGTKWIVAHLFAGVDVDATVTVYSGVAETPAVDTELSFPSATFSGTYSDQTTIEATLTDTEGLGLSDQGVLFELRGEGGLIDSWTATTETDGIASRTFTVELAPGTYQVDAHFAGSEGFESSSTAPAFLEVAKEGTSITTGASGKGPNRKLEATLVDHDGAPMIEGRTVAFHGVEGEFLGSDVTDENGFASIPAGPGYRGQDAIWEARFDGSEDDLYVSSSTRHPS